jgi:hypothetical protein
VHRRHRDSDSNKSISLRNSRENLNRRKWNWYNSKDLAEKSEIEKKQGNKWREILRDQRHTSDTDSDSVVEVRSNLATE